MSASAWLLHFGTQINLGRNLGGLGPPQPCDVQRAVSTRARPKFHGLELSNHLARDSGLPGAMTPCGEGERTASHGCEASLDQNVVPGGYQAPERGPWWVPSVLRTSALLGTGPGGGDAMRVAEAGFQPRPIANESRDVGQAASPALSVKWELDWGWGCGDVNFQV